jgi:CxxC motif-containing protein (DUF1111 family)
LNRLSLCWFVVIASFLALVLTGWQVSADSGASSPPQTSLVLGQSLPGLTEAQKEAFGTGLRAFSKVETREEGLGPVFNGTTCAECHKAGAIGGAAMELTIARVTRIGGLVNGVYSDLAELGGPVLQARSLREFDLSCPIVGEVVPRRANFVSLRITTPLFGAGLIESIPDATILGNVKQNDPDGVHGAANIVFNPENGRNEVGRFGWKAQHSSLHLFAGDAYLNEIGITSASFPDENLPQGQPIPPGWGPTSSPEDEDDDVGKFTDFMRFLAAPGRRLPVTLQAQSGERVFNAIRCSACHLPQMNTGANTVSALANQPVRLYSDLLLHQMGASLADGIQQGKAKGDQFRTAPLWGLSRRSFYLHDGRASRLQDAILAHGGEASTARHRFVNLRSSDQNALLAFLNSL